MEKIQEKVQVGGECIIPAATYIVADIIIGGVKYTKSLVKELNVILDNEGGYEVDIKLYCPSLNSKKTNYYGEEENIVWVTK